MTAPLVPQPHGPQLPGTKQVILAFDSDRGTGRRANSHGRDVQTFVEGVQRPFLPLGLMLWGATVDTLVHGVKVGNMTEIEIGGYTPIPGSYFETGFSFEDALRLADKGELDLNLAARQLLEMSEASVGNHICVSVSGPVDTLCLWGRTYSQGSAFRRASVRQIEPGLFTGQLDEIKLSGPQTVIDVSAPTAEVAAQLLVGLNSASRY